MYLLRVFLIILIIILLFRSFTGYRIVQNDGDREPENDNSRKPDKKKINLNKIPKDEYGSLVRDLTSQMELASANLQFEKAAELRDLILKIKEKI